MEKQMQTTRNKKQMEIDGNGQSKEVQEELVEAIQAKEKDSVHSEECKKGK